MEQTAIYNPETLGEVKGLYVQGTRYRDLFFTTQVPTRSDGTIVEGGAYEQMLQVMYNIKAALTEVGGTLENVLTIRIYVTDMAYYGDINRAYGEVMTVSPLPTRTCVQVAGLVPGYKVEVEAMCRVEEIGEK